MTYLKTYFLQIQKLEYQKVNYLPKVRIQVITGNLVLKEGDLKAPHLTEIEMLVTNIVHRKSHQDNDIATNILKLSPS